MMKIAIAVFGRFHAFDLAIQLQKNSYLKQLISTYPSYKIRQYGIDPNFIKSIQGIEILSRLWNKIPNQIKFDINLQSWFLEGFDRAVEQSLLPDIDIFVGWAGACFASFQHAKSLGARTVVERGSSHMAYQTELLQEEYERWGLKFQSTHPKVYEREIQSYHENDKIAVPSLFVKRTFLEKGIPEEKLIHVPYGTSLEQFSPKKKEDKTFRVIHCGGLSLRKGIPYLLQAFDELQLPNAELWLVGSVTAEMKPFLEKYQSENIILKGHQPQSSLAWFYSQCSVFCLASIEEGLAMVQPQAMACGLPVIHTTNTGGEDIVRDGVDGFCIPIRDVDAIKEKILFFYENPEKRQQMAQNAVQNAKDSFSWEEYGKQIITKYENCFAQ